MTLKLHWSPDSANLPIRMALEMFGLPFEAVRVNRAVGEHRSQEYREKNPQGLIPVLEDDDCVLFETGAILWHLAEKTGRLGPSGPKFSDDDARAAALKWIFYISNTVHADLRIAFNTDRYIDESGVGLLREGIIRRVADHFDLIETHIYNRVIGHPTILPDLYFSAIVRWAQLYPAKQTLITNLARWPTIQAMCARVEAHPGVIRAFMAESIPADQAITNPRLPELPISEVLGASAL